MIHVSLVNKSTVVSDTELIQMAQALQIQVNRDFYPAWGVAAQIYWTPTGDTPTPDHWILGIFDDSTQPGALGYHDISPTAMPIGYVFAKTTINDGNLVSVTASHELLEMLADPDINLSGELDDASGAPSKFYAYEVGDPVEADADGYDIQIPSNFTGGAATVHVSDFTLPSWFESFNTTGPWDFQKHLKAPFTLNPGGYIGFLDLANLSAGWQQQTARTGMTNQQIAASRPQPGSRRFRRRLPRSEWLKSTYPTGGQPIAAGLNS